MRRYSLPFWTPSADNPGQMSMTEIEIARERSRRGAVAILMEHPEKKAEAEAVFGIDYMKRTYPEAYQKTGGNFIKNFLEWTTSR